MAEYNIDSRQSGCSSASFLIGVVVRIYRECEHSYMALIPDWRMARSSSRMLNQYCDLSMREVGRQASPPFQRAWIALVRFAHVGADGCFKPMLLLRRYVSRHELYAEAENTIWHRACGIETNTLFGLQISPTTNPTFAVLC